MESFVVMYDYTAQGEDELDLEAGETILIMSKDTKISGDEGWWVGKVGSGQVGILPSNFITPLALTLGQDSIVVDKLIGEGGFSKVYHGLYNREHQVAVKIPKERTDVALESIVSEGRLNMLLEHPNIVKFIGFYNKGLVMEYSTGGNLANFLGKEELGMGVVVNWATQISQGMSYLHDNNIIHRDLKSSNVLLNKPVESNLWEQTLKITDFGLAREINHTTRMSSAGTYAWMSPEVIKSSVFSKASDVWSYGVLVWELLTGQMPYKGIEPFTIAYGIAMNTLTLTIHEDCPPEWSSLLNAAWDQDPHARPSFSEIQTHLQRIPPSSNENFEAIQSSWRLEIEKVLAEISTKQKEIQNREDEMVRVHKSKEADLEMRERLLKQKELELLHRELTIALKPLPRPRRPKAKFNRNLLKKSSPDELISGPKDFRHTLNIQSVQSPTKTKEPAEYFQSWRRDNSSKYSSLPNIFKKSQQKDGPSQMSQVEKVVCNIGAMFGSILTSMDLRKSNRISPAAKPLRKDSLKYYTYHGKSSRQRSSLPGSQTQISKISTEV